MELAHLYHRTNNEWLKLLSGPAADQAMLELHDLLLPCLRMVLANTIAIDLISRTEDFTSKAIVKIREELPTFNGKAQLTTWALKIAIHIAHIDLRRDQLIENLQAGNLDETKYKSSPPREPQNPVGDLVLEQIQYSILETIGDYIENELTDRQQSALIAIYQQGLSMEDCAHQLDITRYLLAELLLEVRISLRALLEDKFDLGVTDLLSLFDWSE